MFIRSGSACLSIATLFLNLTSALPYRRPDVVYVTKHVWVGYNGNNVQPPATQPPAPVSAAPVVAQAVAAAPSSLVAAAEYQPESPASSPGPPSSSVAPSTGNIPPSSGGGGGKRGVGFDQDSPADLSQWTGHPEVTWGFNWNLDRTTGASPRTLPNGLMFSPTVREVGMASGLGAAISAAAADSGNNGNIIYVNTYNEPDLFGPAAASAAGSYRTDIVEKHRSATVKIGAPSITSTDNVAGKGLLYLDEFMQTCKGDASCPIDFINLHFYGCDNGCTVDDDFQYFKKYVKGGMERASKMTPPAEVWIGEFQRKIGDDVAFLQQALPWLDGPECASVTRYAYFYAKDGLMMSGSSLNAVGQAFVS